MKIRSALGAAAGAATILALTGPVASAAGEPAAGAAEFTMDVGDSYAGGSRLIDFVLAYEGETPEGTPIFIYAPAGWEGGAAGVPGLDPTIDPDPTDEFAVCGDTDPALNSFSAETIDGLGDEIANHIVAVNEAHYGEIGLADPDNPDSDGLVTLIYNVYDQAYYDCEAPSRTAGYFAPSYISDYGMNTIVLDSLDFEEMTGDPENATDLTYEGVVAHELEHLQHSYSDSGETSWVDEGLADFAMFLNGYPVGGSHVAYQQVFHRETSLTRWGGGLENYGASYTFMQYLWDRAGGNGNDDLAVDSTYDGVAGDLLIKTIFAEQADSMEGVANAIATYNADPSTGTEGNPLPDVETLFQDWALAVGLDDEASDLFDISSVDMGGEESWGYTVDFANEVFWDDRGVYRGAMPDAKFDQKKNVPDQTALPFGVSYEYFTNVAPKWKFTLDAPATVGVADFDGDSRHWYAGTASMNEAVLGVDASGDDLSGAELSFATWYFIEEGWDYGFVEALVDGTWVTVPVTAGGEVITTDENPQGNNTEGNGITGTSGGAYFVDEPQYLEATATLPEGATDVRFRYSTDAAYVDTGWFVDAVALDGAPVTVVPESEEGFSDWVSTDGQQVNDFALQVVSTGDLTPGVDDEYAIDNGHYVYRYTGTDIETATFTRTSPKDTVKVVVSNMPSGDLDSLDAGYDLGVVKTTNGKR